MKKRIYLDYAASTPVLKEVDAVMKSVARGKIGNPGSIHSFGQEAMAVIDKSREDIADAIGADFSEIVFTSSATEANNLAIRGVVKKAASKNGKNLNIISSSIEHESILDTFNDLKKDGINAFHAPVSKNGIVDLKQIKKLINSETALVSVMYANNEIGVIEPISEIAKLIKDFRIANRSKYPLFHVDAVQAFQFLNCDVEFLGVDLMTISSHKIYGPKGIAALYIKELGKGSVIEPILTGGGQEFGMRSGTESPALIAGFAKAVKIAVRDRKRQFQISKGLRDHLWKKIKEGFPKSKINGSLTNRLPNNLNIYLAGRNAEDLVIGLDLAGIAVSSGSACRARSLEPSYVIEALGYPKERAMSSLRFSLGRQSTIREIDMVIKQFLKLINKK
ncbi:MAG TPA: cysteine desulfurase family protein [Candidatus Paceibacterota bacterium]